MSIESWVLTWCASALLTKADVRHNLHRGVFVDTEDVIYQPHDKFFRSTLAIKEVAQEFFAAHLPSRVANRINLETIELYPTSYVDRRLEERVADIVYKTKTINGKDCYLYLLTEHQTTPAEDMAMRFMEYKSKIMRHHKNGVAAEWPAVVAIMCYQGSDGKPYPYHLSLAELFGDPFVLECYLADAILVDHAILTDEQMLQYNVAILFHFMLKYMRSGDLLVHLPLLREAIHRVAVHLPQDKAFVFISQAMVYLLCFSQGAERQIVHEYLEKEEFMKENKIMETAAELFKSEGRAEGKAEGKAEGRAEGKAESTKAIALKLLQGGMGLPEVAHITELSEDELKALQESA